LFAEQKIAIAMHHCAWHTRKCQRAQLFLDPLISWIGIIVANPEFKQITQDVHLLGLAGSTAQELHELSGNGGLRTIEM
jgi:G:T-mismatch repair DNA endonuclease (very short patch repair protein)